MRISWQDVVYMKIAFGDTAFEHRFYLQMTQFAPNMNMSFAVNVPSKRILWVNVLTLHILRSFAPTEILEQAISEAGKRHLPPKCAKDAIDVHNEISTLDVC